MIETRYATINALGVLDNPNLPQAAAADVDSLGYASGMRTIDERALADARSAGLSAVNITLGHVAGSTDAFAATVRDITSWNAFIADHAGALRRVLTVADIAAASDAGQVGVIYGFQNTEMLGRELDRVRLFAKMGVRVIQLTYNGRNAVGDGATVADDRGLSRFGAEAVERLLHRLARALGGALRAGQQQHRPVVGGGGCQAARDRAATCYRQACAHGVSLLFCEVDGRRNGLTDQSIYWR